MNDLQCTNETFLYKKYIFYFILERGTQFVVRWRDRWRDIYSERGLLAPYLLPGARGCQRLHPLESRIERDISYRLRIPGSTLDSDWADSVNLTTWSSYHVISFRLHTWSTSLLRHSAISLFTKHNVTACQTHGVTRN